MQQPAFVGHAAPLGTNARVPIPQHGSAAALTNGLLLIADAYQSGKEPT